MAQDSGLSSSNPRIMMWCTLRSVSTAFTKCMSFVDGVEVWLEPFFISKSVEEIFDLFNPDKKFPLALEGNEELYRDLAEKLTFGGNIDEYNLERLS